MTPEEREQRLKRLREDAARIESAEAEAQKTSLDRARDMLALYEDSAWAEEMLEALPPSRPSDSNGVPRFAYWLENVQGIKYSNRRVGRYLQAAQFVRSTTQGRASGLSTERAVRPFYRLTQKGYPELQGRAIERAIELANGGEITSAHSAQAVSEVIASIPKPELATREGRRKAEVDATRAKMHVDHLEQSGDLALLSEVIQYAMAAMERAEKAMPVKGLAAVA